MSAAVKKTSENKIGKGKPGPGRPKGVPNKATAAVKDMVIGALNGAHPEGGMAYLIEQAGKNPKAFLTLVGKMIPLDVNANLSGQVGLLPAAVVDDLA